MLNLCLCLIIGLFVIVVASIVYAATPWRYHDTLENIDCILWLILAILLFVAVVFDISNYFIGPQEMELTSTEHIVAISNDSKMYMSRYRGKEEMYYQYMVKLSNGGYVYNQVPAKASRTTIYYTKNGNYRVEWYKQKIGKLGFVDVKTINKIYIPEGSIAEDFNIDMSK